MFSTYPVPEPLRPYIVSMYSVHWKKEDYANGNIREMILPGGSAFMVFQINGRLKGDIDNTSITPPKYYTIGQQTHSYVITSKDPRVHLIGIAFRPAGLYALFRPKIAMSDLVNRPIASRLLLKNEHTHHLKAFESAVSIPAKVDALTHMLSDCAKTPKEIPGFITVAIEQIEKQNGCVPIHHIAKRLHVSERYFQKRFKEVTGIPPSVYSRIVRFNMLFSEIDPKNPKMYSVLKDLFQYYDSAHFSKDFKKYCGVPPSTFHLDKFNFLKQAWVENPFFRD